MHLNLCRIQERLLFPFARTATTCLLLPARSRERTGRTATQAWILEPSSEGISTDGLTVHNHTNEARDLQNTLATDFRQAEPRTSPPSPSTSER